MEGQENQKQEYQDFRKKEDFTNPPLESEEGSSLKEDSKATNSIPKKPTPPPAPTTEKKSLLAREEITTMEKDISNIREEEAQTEKERLSKLKSENIVRKPLTATRDIQPPKDVNPVPKPEIQPEPQNDSRIIPETFKTPTSQPTIKKPSSFKKVAARILIVLIILLAGEFVWLLSFNWDKEPILLKGEIKNEQQTNTETEPNIQISTPEIVEKTATWGFYIPSVNRTIDTIIIHSTYNDTDSDVYNIDKILNTFKNYRVLTHYMIDREGIIYQLAPDSAIAYHAGSSQMPDGSRKNKINNYSIGIDLIYNETEEPNTKQIQSLVNLVYQLKNEYQIPINNILTKKDISLSGSDTPWNFGIEDFINYVQ